MIGAPRIIPRAELWPSMRHEPAADPRLECGATIKLDGRRYRCGREHVDGIHDAFAQHGDGGAVRPCASCRARDEELAKAQRRPHEQRQIAGLGASGKGRP